jgi:hypothetical protein
VRIYLFGLSLRKNQTVQSFKLPGDVTRVQTGKHKSSGKNANTLHGMAPMRGVTSPLSLRPRAGARIWHALCELTRRRPLGARPQAADPPPCCASTKAPLPMARDRSWMDSRAGCLIE